MTKQSAPSRSQRGFECVELELGGCLTEDGHSSSERRTRSLWVGLAGASFRLLRSFGLVGIISQADIATNLDEEKVGDLVEAISASS